MLCVVAPREGVDLLLPADCVVVGYSALLGVTNQHGAILARRRAEPTVP